MNQAAPLLDQSSAPVVRTGQLLPDHQSSGPYVVGPDGRVVLGSLQSTRPQAPDDIPGRVLPGNEHFSLWLKQPGTKAPKFITAWEDQPWPEFIPGQHYDIRQPSRLRPLCSPPPPTEPPNIMTTRPPPGTLKMSKLTPPETPAENA